MGVRLRPDSYPVATVFMCFGGERRLGLRLRPDSYPVVVDVFLGERRLVVRVEARAGSH